MNHHGIFSSLLRFIVSLSNYSQSFEIAKTLHLISEPLRQFMIERNISTD